MFKKITFVTLVCLLIFSTSVFAATPSEGLAKLLPTDVKTEVLTVENGETTLTKNVSKNFRAAQNLYLYQYDAKANKLELLSDEVVVNANGDVTITVKGELCVLAESPITENLAKPVAPEPVKATSPVSKTGDVNTDATIALAGAMIILSVGTLIVIKQNFA